MTEKEQKFYRTSKALLKIVSRSSIEELKFSDLAKQAGVSRAWIYKFLGNNRDELSHFAAVEIGKKFAETHKERRKPTSAKDLSAFLEEGTTIFFQDLEEYPFLPSLYFKNIGLKNPIGLAIEKVKSTYLHRLQDEITLALKTNKVDSLCLAEHALFVRMCVALEYTRDGLSAPKKIKAQNKINTLLKFLFSDRLSKK